MPDDNDWQCGWEDARKRQLTAGFDATPKQRLAWLEEMLAFAYRCGALPRSEDSPALLRDAPDLKRKDGGAGWFSCTAAVLFLLPPFQCAFPCQHLRACSDGWEGLVRRLWAFSRF